MLCKNCGTELANGAIFCSNCGAKQQQYQNYNNQNYNQQNYYRQNQGYNQTPYGQQGPYNGNKRSFQDQLRDEAQINGPVQADFGLAIKRFIAHYADFNGRASKSEYWWAVLFNFLVSLVCGFIPVVGWLISLALIVPSLSICIRRLHDTGREWYYYLMGLIPFAGFIILIVFFCQDSVGDNQWGPGPKYLPYNNY